jgi:hypothetical protein
VGKNPRGTKESRDAGEWRGILEKGIDIGEGTREGKRSAIKRGKIRLEGIERVLIEKLL